MHVIIRSIIFLGAVLLIWSGFVPPGFADECESERVGLQMLGTRGPEFLDDRASTGYLLWLDNQARIIVDAGPGTVQRFKQSGARYADVQAMLFTHFHADHSADFAAYIKGGSFTDRTAVLNVFGPSGAEFVVSAEQFAARNLSADGLYPYLGNFLAADAKSSYKIQVTTVPWSYQDVSIIEVYNSDGIHITAVPVHHGPFPALGYRIEMAGCVLSFTGDMSGRLQQMPKLAQGSDILVAHNAIAENAEGVPALLHMKPSYIGKLAAEAKVKKLLLTHLMKRTVDRTAATTELIGQRYSGPVEFPDDLDIIRP